MGDGRALRLPLSTAERHKEGSRTFKCPATFFVRLRRENSLDTLSLVRAVRAAAAFARRPALLALACAASLFVLRRVRAVNCAKAAECARPLGGQPRRRLVQIIVEGRELHS